MIKTPEKGKFYRVRSNHSFHPDRVGRVEQIAGIEKNFVLLSIPPNHVEMLIVKIEDLEPCS